MPPRLLITVVVCLALLAGNVAAQAPEHGLWSVQTIALRDLREAQRVAQRLQVSGFDAYTEFAMDGGLQFVRVRVGCFTTREAAETMANAIAGRIEPTAAAVEATADAPVVGCVKMEIGFLKPFAWDEVEEAGAAPAFRVLVAGLEAHVTHTGERWRVLQGGEAVPLIDPALPVGRFRQANVEGVPMVLFEGPLGDVLLCPGTLIDSVGNVAISEQGEALVACSLENMGAR